jgi:hypothetical protein
MEVAMFVEIEKTSSAIEGEGGLESAVEVADQLRSGVVDPPIGASLHSTNMFPLTGMSVPSVFGGSDPTQV